MAPVRATRKAGQEACARAAAAHGQVAGEFVDGGFMVAAIVAARFALQTDAFRAKAGRATVRGASRPAPADRLRGLGRLRPATGLSPRPADREPD